MIAYCYQFALDGTCAFGTSCKFPHRADVNFPIQAIRPDEGPAANQSGNVLKSIKTKKKKKKATTHQGDPNLTVQGPLHQECPAIERLEGVPQLEKTKEKKKKKKKKKAKIAGDPPEPVQSYEAGVNGPMQAPHLGEHPTTAKAGDIPKPKKTKKKKKKKPRSTEIQPKPQDSLDVFFAQIQYHPFRYNRNSPSYEEFFRMCDFFEWRDNSLEKRDARDAFKEALVLQFNSIYGTDENDPESWRKLCLALNVSPLPQGLEAMRDAVQHLHVNLVDLVDTWRIGGRVRIFGTLAGLRDYTCSTGKFFERESAYAGGVLKFLLREITGRYYGSRGNAGKENGKRQGSGKKKGKKMPA